ncbi:MAG: hypothetical protein MEQ74_05155 [Paracoccus sp.]|nr:hypothetical protein [Paracoccus sp. (in: a-proteobacteria)]
MSSLRALRNKPTKLQLSGGPADVWGVAIETILDLLDDYPGLVVAYQSAAGESRSAAIVSAIRASGREVMHRLIDLGTRSEPGTAAEVAAAGDLTAIDQAEIIATVVKLSLPEDRVGKLMAVGEGYIGALGQEKA